MKKLLALLIATALFNGLNAQTDYLYWNYEGCVSFAGTIDPGDNYIRGIYNGSTGTLTPDDGTNAFFGAPYAVSPNKKVYATVDDGQGTGGIMVVSVNANPYDDPPNPVPVSAAFDVNGDANTNYVRPEAMDIDVATNTGWVISREDNCTDVCVTTYYITSFKINFDGTAGSFQNFGTLSVPSLTEWNVYDIANDGSNLYFVIGYYDQNFNQQSAIYRLPVSTLTTGENTPAKMTDFVDSNIPLDEFGDPAYRMLVTGIAYSSGNLYIANNTNYRLFSNNAEFYILDPSVTTFDLTKPFYTETARCGVSALTAISALALPVKFGELKARILNNNLQVSWETKSETNNDHFEIEVSRDGKAFEKAGNVKSKAANGNSTISLQYEFETPLQKGAALAGVSLLFFGVSILFAMNRRRRLLPVLMMIAGLIAIGVSCTKSDQQVDSGTEGKLFVKIAQVDKDGKKEYSAVITAYKAD